MTSLAPPPLRVAIIGGGVAGALAAIILARHAEIGAITVLDRDGAFGRGLAYAAPAAWHRINVPAYKMGGLDAGDDSGFVDWLKHNGLADWPDFAASFVPRWAYGSYICDHLGRLTDSGRVTARRDTAQSIATGADGYRVVTASGDDLEADLVFVCIGNPPPSPLPGLPATPRNITNVWAPGALDGIGADDRVLVIGTGATAVDVVVDLVHRGVRAPITMVSRRGLLPLVDVPAQDDPAPVASFPVPTARGILVTLLQDARRKMAAGLPWQVTVDSFRPHIAALYAGAPEAERDRFARHLRAIWMVHRHRLAPDVAAQFGRMQQDGRLQVIAGRIDAAGTAGQGFDVTVARRGRGTLRVAADWILNCTGPEERYDRLADPLIRSLLASGHARPGPNGLGLDVDPGCRLRNRAGEVQPGLYAIGPATRGAFWEVTAASSIRQQLLDVAAQLAAVVR